MESRPRPPPRPVQRPGRCTSTTAASLRRVFNELVSLEFQSRKTRAGNAAAVTDASIGVQASRTTDNGVRIEGVTLEDRITAVADRDRAARGDAAGNIFCRTTATGRGVTLQTCSC